MCTIKANSMFHHIYKLLKFLRETKTNHAADVYKTSGLKPCRAR